MPGLGIKRGLERDLVVAPYATAMALMVSPATARPDRSGPTPVQGFALWEGGREIAYLRFAPDGSIEVRGNVLADPGGRFVDIEAPPGTGCAATDAGRVTLHPLPAS